jgi:hypothetical protein
LTFSLSSAHVAIFRQTRTRKAIDIMLSNTEGLVWIRLNKPAASEQEAEQPLIPIKWTARRCRSDLPRKESSRGKEWECRPLCDTRVCDVSTAGSDAADSSKETPVAIIETENDVKMAADSEDDLCIVCMAREANFQLLPCRHDKFCQHCIIETLCAWVRPEPPSCPLCRGRFHTMVLLD